jgi:hypothetical protein
MGLPLASAVGLSETRKETLMKHRTVLVASAILLLGALFSQTAQAGSGAASSPLTGDGSGRISVALTREDQGTLVAQITANVQNASPNTLYSVQRALDSTADGTCDSLGPFEEQGTLNTNSAGAGGAHIEVHSPAPSGATFDVLFQLVGDDGSLLVSECMTLTVR